MNFMWVYLFMLLVISILLSIVCFLSGCHASKCWYGRVETRAIVEWARPKPRAMRPAGRLHAFTQCDRRSTDINEILRLTINAIRDELRHFGDMTDGTKVILAERLQLRRRRNEELILPFPNDEEDE